LRIGHLTRFRVIDLETTGIEPPAEIIEFGRADVVAEAAVCRIERPMARLYRPLNGIPPETMAVHHITEADFDEKTLVCTPDRLRQAVCGVAQLLIFSSRTIALLSASSSPKR
jgi:exodeoxyribonuclease X